MGTDIEIMSQSFSAGHGLRIHQVTGDRLAPDIRPGDFVVCSPCTAFQGEGRYVLDAGSVAIVQYVGGGNVRVGGGTKYPADTMTVDEFGEIVTAQVAGILTVTHPDILERAAGFRV